MAETREPRRLGVVPQGIRLDVLCAFLLMSVVPLVVLLLVAGWFAFPSVREFYHLEQWFPLIASPSEATWWLLSILTLTMAISLLGSAYLAVKIITPVIHLSHHAKSLAAGDYDARMTDDARTGELGDLSAALKKLTSQIRTNMVELKQLGDRTTQMNFEINTRMVMLSGLLQIGELIGGGAGLDIVLDLVVEKLALLDPQGFSFLSLQPVEGLPVTLRRSHNVDLGRLTIPPPKPATVTIDAGHRPSAGLEPLWKQLDGANVVLQPVFVRGKPVGMLGVGNRYPEFAWTQESVDLAGIFAKQISIALENDLLLRKTKLLAIHDELTGAYNETYVRQRLTEELKRALLYQRPCALAMFAIPGLADYRRRAGEPQSEQVLKQAVRIIQESVTDIDRVGRFGGNEIAVLLPERSKRQALEVAEAVRRRANASLAELAAGDALALVSSVVENPLDGVTADELITKASAALSKASPTQGHGA
ncbi:MAG: diguanylate cyclase [Candidatus Omnitrophica bacterium]|nr:diguanylate cyclase [Candidatus Omnitrophota bacterium]